MVLQDVDFFQHLEMHLRGEDPPLCGRDHLTFRLLCNPVKSVVGGDLCEIYNSRSQDAKKKRATYLVSTSPNKDV